MGTSACIRIIKDGDYIEHHSRWDGFYDVFQKKVDSISVSWQNSINHIRDNVNKDYHSPLLEEWLDSIEGLVAQNQLNPTIENTSVLLSAADFSHYHPLPIDTVGSRDMNDYWGIDNPQFSAKITGNGKIKYSENPNQKVAVRDMNTSLSEYDIIRITSIEEGSELDTYIDLKVRKGYIPLVVEKVYRLPQLYRDILQVSRLPLSMRKEVHVKGGLFSLAQSLKDYYNPLEYFDKMKKIHHENESWDMSTKASRKLDYDMVLDEVLSSIPMDMTISSFSSQVCMSCPGIVLPLTKKEQLSDYKPVYHMYLDESRLPNVFLELHGIDWLKIVNGAITDEEGYRDHHGIDYFPELETKVIEVKNNAALVDKKLVLFKLEYMLIDCLSAQRDIDLKEFKKIREDRKAKLGY